VDCFSLVMEKIYIKYHMSDSSAEHRSVMHVAATILNTDGF